MKRSDAVAAALLAGAAGAYFASLTTFGLHLGEDGDVVYLIYRAFSGQRPYLDFASGYAPGYFLGNAALLDLFGDDLLVLRCATAVVSSLAVAALYLLSRPRLPAALAVVPPLAYVALMPVYAGEFATFNVPYPAWYAVLAFAAALLAMRRSVAGGSAAWAAVGGALAASGFAVKPNTGAFSLAALALVLLSTHEPGRGWARRLMWWGLLAGSLAGLALIFDFRIGSRDARLFLGPVFALGGVLALRAARDGGEPRPGFEVRAFLLLAGFALLTAPWMLQSLAALGGARFLRDVLFVGSGHTMFFYMSVPELDLWDAAVVLGGIAAFVSGRLVARRVLPARALLVAAAVGIAAGMAVLYLVAPMPEGFQRALMKRLEHLAYGAAIAAHWGGVLWLARDLLWRRAAISPNLAAICIGAPLLFLSMYPRSDFFHWVLSAPVTLILGVLLLWRATAPIFVAGVGPRWRALAAAAPAYALIAALLYPAFDLIAQMHAPGAEIARLALERAPVVLEAGRRAKLDDLAHLTGYIQAHSREGDTLLGFPNLHLVNYLTGRHVPGRYGSFHPGWPDHAIEAEIVDDLERKRTPLIAVNHDQQLYMGHAPLYYFMLREHVRKHYRHVASFGSYDVLARRDLDLAADGGETPSSAALADGIATESCLPAIVAAERRRPQSADSLASCWTDGHSDALQERGVAIARTTRDPAGALPLAVALRDGRLGPRASLLAVRALGDIADARSFAVLVEARETSTDRLRDELTTTLFVIAGRSYIDQWLFTPRADATIRLASDPAMAAQATAFVEDADPRLRYAGAWLAGLTRVPAAAPALRRMLAEGDVAAQGIAADALLKIGVRDGVGEQLLATLARDEMFTPSPLLQWAQTGGDEAVAQLARTYGEGNWLQRQTIAYIAAALGDARLAQALTAGLGDADPRVREAARFALSRLRATNG